MNYCDICKSRRKTTTCIQIWTLADVESFCAHSNVYTFHLCKRCTKMFRDLLYNSNKEMLERAVRECSNINSVSEVSTAGVPLND